MLGNRWLGDSEAFWPIYKKATEKPYGYLLADHHPRTDDNSVSYPSLDRRSWTSHRIATSSKEEKCFKISFRCWDGRRQRGGGKLEDWSKSCTTCTNQLRARWNQHRADTQRRLKNETAKWHEGTSPLKWKWDKPNPSLSERPMEKGRQTQFKAKNAFKPGIPRPQLNKGTKRALAAGVHGGGSLGPARGFFDRQVIKKRNKKK